MSKSINQFGNPATDPLETILELVLDATGPGQVAIGNGGGSTDDPDKEWYVMCYWLDDENGGDWEIFVEAPSLRAALCQIIAHPRFGQ